MALKLYEYAPTRSARVRWTLLELGVEFEAVPAKQLMGSDELKRINPLGKLPAFEDDGRPLFESAAISTYLADKHPDRGLIAAAGSYDRALHEQWCYLALGELEAALWNTAKHTWRLPEAERIAGVQKQNDADARAALAALDAALEHSEYLVGGSFSVTDIIVAYAANWARLTGLTRGFENVEAWLGRLGTRPHCTLVAPNDS